MLSAMRVKHNEVEWLLHCIGISSLLLLADILYCSIRWIRYTTVIQDPDVLPVVKQCSYLRREGYIFIYIYFFFFCWSHVCWLCPLICHQKNVWRVSGFRHCVNQVFTLLGYYTAFFDCWTLNGATNRQSWNVGN